MCKLNQLRNCFCRNAHFGTSLYDLKTHPSLLGQYWSVFILSGSFYFVPWRSQGPVVHGPESEPVAGINAYELSAFRQALESMLALYDLD